MPGLLKNLIGLVFLISFDIIKLLVYFTLYTPINDAGISKFTLLGSTSPSIVSVQAPALTS